MNGPAMRFKVNLRGGIPPHMVHHQRSDSSFFNRKLLTLAWSYVITHCGVVGSERLTHRLPTKAGRAHSSTLPKNKAEKRVEVG